MLEQSSEASKGRLLRDAEKEVRTEAAESMKRLEVVHQGLCPACGAPLKKDHFFSVCEQYGWNTYNVPRQGVRIHLTRGESVNGDKCNIAQGGRCAVHSQRICHGAHSDGFCAAG